jgi:hypothetical protein
MSLPKEDEMKEDVLKLTDQNDLLAEGFYKVDEKYIEVRPPKIKWGKIYLSWGPDKRVEYLEKFARSMNQAAYLVQKERDELNTLCQLKEEQLTKMSHAMKQNMDMLQHEVTKMNEQRQGYNTEVARLNAKIRELEDK